MTETRFPGDFCPSPASGPGRGTAERWLAYAHPSPDTALGEWNSAANLALIPLGRFFEAVRLPEPIVHGAVAAADPYTVSDRLGRCLGGGPVIHDPGFRRYYALVPPGTARTWREPAVECLGDGTYLGVPRSDRTEYDEQTQASYWPVPMTRPGRLSSAVDVLALVMAGRCLEGEDEV
ncbi:MULTISPECIES: hypothetical protein [unclassified Streptomyces]|uniref:hypothetical protein n=1 Tax=unclassified Streptomyces TaxID=2593676 RepID=UPI001F18E344|nr:MULTISPECIES: hypothetical protein [unclassified Streptomyces]